MSIERNDHREKREEVSASSAESHSVSFSSYLEKELRSRGQEHRSTGDSLRFSAHRSHLRLLKPTEGKEPPAPPSRQPGLHTTHRREAILRAILERSRGPQAHHSNTLGVSCTHSSAYVVVRISTRQDHGPQDHKTTGPEKGTVGPWDRRT